VRGILPDDAVGHLGFTGTSLWIDAARPRVFVLLTNRVHPAVPTRRSPQYARAFHELAPDAVKGASTRIPLQWRLMDSPRTTFPSGPSRSRSVAAKTAFESGSSSRSRVHVLIVAPLDRRVPKPHTAVEAEIAAVRNLRCRSRSSIRFRGRPRSARRSRRVKPPPRRGPSRCMEPVPEAAWRERRARRIARERGRRTTSPRGASRGARTVPRPGVPPRRHRTRARPRRRRFERRRAPKDISAASRIQEGRRSAPAAVVRSPGGRGGGAAASRCRICPRRVWRRQPESRGRTTTGELRSQIHGIIWRAWHNRLLDHRPASSSVGAENRRGC
jgi:hypothetical protein